MGSCLEFYFGNRPGVFYKAKEINLEKKEKDTKET